MNPDGAFYRGRVTHRRLTPRRHSLAYDVFYTLLDLDRLDDLGARCRFFSRNRLNLLSFHDADHLDGAPGGLRGRVDAVLAQAGIDLRGGRIELLCMPRVLGHAFNPLSLYFCHDAQGALVCILYEVNNTFRQRHSYLVPVEQPAGAVIHQRCEKTFYVSPFMDMDLDYRFRIEPPAARVSIGVVAERGGEAILGTAFRGERHALCDRAILGAVLRYPWLGLKVLAGIHWEALRIWRKGIALRPRPAPPEEAVTLVNPH